MIIPALGRYPGNDQVGQHKTAVAGIDIPIRPRERAGFPFRDLHLQDAGRFRIVLYQHFLKMGHLRSPVICVIVKIGIKTGIQYMYFTQYLTFYAWLILLSLTFLEFIHAVACIRTPFLFKAE